MAISFRPASVRNDFDEGKRLLGEGSLDGALASFDRSIARKPDFADGHVGRTNTLRAMGRFVEALASYDIAIALSPADAAMLSNRGMILLDLQRDQDALKCFDAAIAGNPLFSSAHHNRAIALLKLQDLQEALASCNSALALEPHTARFQGTKAVALLQLGAFADGWRLYEARKRSENPAGNKDFLTPAWLGDGDVAGKTVFIHAEQGMGDTLQFSRYAALVQAKGAQVIMSVQTGLLRLLQRSNPGVAVIDEAEVPDSFDLHCPMMSLPLALGTTLGTIPTAVPYLHPDADRAAQWRVRLAELPGMKIGLVWAGSPRPDQPDANAIDKRRSITLAHYADLADIPGISLISLQKGQTATAPPGMILHDWTDELTDFADTADLVAALDLVITVDTSVAHLAGGLGTPVWILNRFDQCWRWLEGRDDSPWYPTARLFRQPAPGHWGEVIAAVRQALLALVSAPAPPPPPPHPRHQE